MESSSIRRLKVAREAVYVFRKTRPVLALCPTAVARLWLVAGMALLYGACSLPWLVRVRIPFRLRPLGWVWIGDWSQLLTLAEVFCDGVYEEATQFPAPALIVDIGANAGFASAFFCLRFPAARVIAFEPDPRVAHLAARNLRRFPHASVECAAVADQEGFAELVTVPGQSWGNYLSSASEDNSGRLVPTTTLDAIIQRFGKVNLMKLDAEGSEYRILAKADGLSTVDFIIGEAHTTPECRPSDLPALLSAFDLNTDFSGPSLQQTFIAVNRRLSEGTR